MPDSPVPSPSDRFRLQVEMTNERVSAIDKLVKITGMGSRKEFLDNALSLMAWAVRERQHGRIIASVSPADSSNYREVLMPSLAHLSQAYATPQEAG